MKVDVVTPDETTTVNLALGDTLLVTADTPDGGSMIRRGLWATFRWKLRQEQATIRALRLQVERHRQTLMSFGICPECGSNDHRHYGDCPWSE